MREDSRALLALLVGFLSVPAAIQGHHSFSAVYDAGTVTELEGAVTRVLWRNPHVRFTIEARSASGPSTLWDIETHSVSILRRMQISPDILKVGDRVRVAGNPGKRLKTEIFAHNVLLPDGREVVLQPGSSARWSKRTVGSSATWLASAGKTTDPKRGIFRVWSTSLSTPFLFPEIEGNKPVATLYPLTATARAALARFDPVADSPIANCAPKGMPTIMEQPYPMEFVDEPGRILLRLEEYDTVRTIQMTAAAGTRPPVPTLLGHSIGRWEGNSLVVTTTGSTWRHFNTVGVPLSASASMVERFTPSADGSRLDYELTITDPTTFTKPVTLKKYWIWLPDTVLSPYECTNGR
jgi:hypothetical protein